jgi:hypothetical protein
MRLISVRVVGRLLIRFVSASAVRIALGTSLTTSQPAIALQSGPAAIVQHSAPVVLAAAQTEGNDSAAARSNSHGTAGFVGSGLGWG